MRSNNHEPRGMAVVSALMVQPLSAMNMMNISRPSSVALLILGALSPLAGQLAVPEPPPLTADQPVVVSSDAPLASLDAQLGVAAFDQRGAFASAYDEANRLVDTKVAELRARGLTLAEEASLNLEAARENARQVFRDLSLTTEETWQNARHNALQALRKIQESLRDLEKSATPRQA